MCLFHLNVSLSPSQSTMIPSSITFNWRMCENIPLGMKVYDQPVSLNGKLYVRRESSILAYTPGCDLWTELPPLPVKRFTIATLNGQLLVVGGIDRSTDKITSTILTCDNYFQKWIQLYSAMPRVLTFPAVLGFQNCLIVAGGENSNSDLVHDVNIFDTISDQWSTAQPLPSTDYYETVLIGDTMYLVGETVLQAHVPTLISGARSGVWKALPNHPYYYSFPVTIGNTLLTVGGRERPSFGANSTSSIHMYNPTTNCWTRVGDLPQKMTNYLSRVIDSELFVLSTDASYQLQSVYISKLTLSN